MTKDNKLNNYLFPIVNEVMMTILNNRQRIWMKILYYIYILKKLYTYHSKVQK